jgi:hypothetical protein
VGLLHVRNVQVWPDDGGLSAGSGTRLGVTIYSHNRCSRSRGVFDPAELALAEMKRAPAEADALRLYRVLQGMALTTRPFPPLVRLFPLA